MSVCPFNEMQISRWIYFIKWFFGEFCNTRKLFAMQAQFDCNLGHWFDCNFEYKGVCLSCYLLGKSIRKMSVG